MIMMIMIIMMTMMIMMMMTMMMIMMMMTIMMRMTKVMMVIIIMFLSFFKLTNVQSHVQLRVPMQSLYRVPVCMITSLYTFGKSECSLKMNDRH